jgi:signal peptide peptidase SppA
MAVVNPSRSIALGPLLAEPWAVAPNILSQLLEHLAARGDPREFFARFEPSKAQGRVATPGVVPIHGFISERSSIWDDLFGGTSVEAIREMFRAAMADSSVSAVILDVDSPGGTVAGVTELANEIRAARGNGKRIVAVANSLAASAAYWLASQADELVATPSASVGSIGVYAVHQDFSEAYQQAGVKNTLISAGPHKTEGNEFEPLTDEARAAMQERADAFYAQFVDDVARGRGVTSAQVKADFGGGRVLLAKPALAAGMIDYVGTFEDAARKTIRLASKSNRAEVDGIEFEADFPFSGRLALLSEDAEALLTHATHRAQLRAKEGRDPLSDNQLIAVRTTRAAMDALLALADPAAPPAADPPPPPAADPPPAPPVVAQRFRSDADWQAYLRGVKK